MNIALVYDTETTGLPLFKEPSEHPGQPHIVQLGAVLVDLDTWQILSTLDVMVRPEGWTIPEEVSKIHGITTEMAGDLGVPESLAAEMLLDMWRGRLRIAHNEQFEARIVRTASMRHFEPTQADAWKEGVAECTANLATPIVKIPPTERMKAAGFTKFKTANLGEAFKHFTGRDLVGAHSALVDVRACLDVYRAIKTVPEGQQLAA